MKKGLFTSLVGGSVRLGLAEFVLDLLVEVLLLLFEHEQMLSEIDDGFPRRIAGRAPTPGEVRYP